ncbi:MAG TPA: glucose-6-phosphate dehydrogenase, partial [Candidatus Polarisedimenticolaceae bacterium]|nr:glucose-6-phosphate dehydrogenase [Candidatus Polarisedimenticolaceae bacterium]
FMNDQRPISLTIFGISGDLASRKLLPALYWLLTAGELPAHMIIIGVSRQKISTHRLMKKVTQFVGKKANPEIIQRLETMIRMVQMDSGQASEYPKLKQVYKATESTDEAVRLLYLALPPKVSQPVVAAMAEAGITKKAHKDIRLLLEKPFGFDLASAKNLDSHLDQAVQETQIYRIDHYLAKETAQNITVFRFANPIMTAVWNNHFIERIEIEASEKIGIENRANFYEQTGALRDVVQSHLLSLLALVTMDEPKAGNEADFHRKRRKALESIKPFGPKDVAARAHRGQYATYRKEVGNPDSITETWAALNLESTNRRWKGVSLYLSGGKALDSRRTTIRVFFKASARQHYNCLTFRLQPREGIELQLEAKREGLNTTTEPIFLKFAYGENAAGRRPDGYERVILDAINGDRTSFLTGPEVRATWRLMEPVLRAWQRNATGMLFYQPGSKPPLSSLHDERGRIVESS